MPNEDQTPVPNERRAPAHARDHGVRLVVVVDNAPVEIRFGSLAEAGEYLRQHAGINGGHW